MWILSLVVEASWNVMEHRDVRVRNWGGNRRMQWVASTLHTPSEHVVSSITTADAHTSAASGRLNWRPPPIKWTRSFRRKMKYGFCAYATTFQIQSTKLSVRGRDHRNLFCGLRSQIFFSLTDFRASCRPCCYFQILKNSFWERYVTLCSFFPNFSC